MAKKIVKPAKKEADQEMQSVSDALIAKKAFVICHNEYMRKIEAGEEIGDVPEIFHQNLKTEGVL